MTSYYVNAYNRNGKKIAMPVEHKHTYDNYLTYKNSTEYTKSGGFVNVNQYGCKSSTTTGHKATFESFDILWFSENFTLKPGVSADGGIIGDKIMLKSVLFDMRFQLNRMAFLNPTATEFYGGSDNDGIAYNVRIGDTYDENYQVVNTLNPGWRRDYRLMIVHFDEIEGLTTNELQNYIAHWFNSIFVPLEYDNETGTDLDNFTTEMSVKAKLKRESTQYNGKYNIIKDITFTLTPNHYYEHITFSLDPHKQLNFKRKVPASGDHDFGLYEASNDWYRNTIMILFKPISYRADMDPISYNCYNNRINSNSTRSEMYYTQQIKYTYYDI